MLSFGTQTAGSVIRPAAYCGVIGFKPTRGSYSTAGVKPLSPYLDTVGLFARAVADIELFDRALRGSEKAIPQTRVSSPRCGVRGARASARGGGFGAGATRGARRPCCKRWWRMSSRGPGTGVAPEGSARTCRGAHTSRFCSFLREEDLLRGRCKGRTDFGRCG